jgi:hypothetical protein
MAVKSEPRFNREISISNELSDTIAAYLAKGNYLETACYLVGISKTQALLWIKRGKENKGGKSNLPYIYFYNVVRRAMAYSEDHLVGLVNEAGKEDWKAAAWMLSKKNPEGFGKKREYSSASLYDDIVERQSGMKSKYSSLMAALADAVDSDSDDLTGSDNE